MKVQISNFRCFKQKVFEFPESKLILLKGGSGIGKSTTLEAIRWCLFGNLRNIYPSGGNSTSSNPTVVFVDFEYLKIYRSQPPETLRLWAKKDSKSENFDIYLENESAQKYIDGIFGSKEIWYSSSYIPQGERCPLMTQSNVDKMNLLCDILFGNRLENNGPDNPDWYIGKIEEESNKNSKELTGQTALFNSIYSKYTEACGTYKPSGYWSDLTKVNEETFEAMTQQITNFKTQINELTTEMLKVKGKETELSMLNERFESLEKLIKSFDSINIETLKLYREQISHLEQELKTLSSEYLSVVSKEQSKQLLEKKIFDNKTLLENFKIEDSILDTSLLEKQKVSLLDSCKTQEENLLKLKTLENNLKLYIDVLGKNNESLLKNQEKFNKLTLLKDNNESIEILKQKLQNTRYKLKVDEVKSREPELPESFGFSETDNYDKISSNLSQYIYYNDFVVNLLKTHNLYKEAQNPLEAKPSVLAHIESINKILAFVAQQKIEVAYDENRKKTYEKLSKLAEEMTTFQSEKESLLKEINHEKINSTSSFSDIISIKTEINLSIGDNLNCPSCSECLDFCEGKLCKLTKVRISKAQGQALMSLLDKLSLINQKISTKENESVKLKLEYDSLPIPNPEYINSSSVYTEDTLKYYTKFISDLGAITWEKLESNYECVKNKNDAERIIKALASLKLRQAWEVEYTNALRSFNSSIPILPCTDEFYLQTFESELMSLPILNIEKSNLTKAIDEANLKIQELSQALSSLDNIEIIQASIVNYKNSINELEKQIAQYNQYILVKTETEKLQESYNSILITQSSVSIKESIDVKNQLLLSLKETVSGYSSYENTMNEFDKVKKKKSLITILKSSEVLGKEIEDLNTSINDLETKLTEGKQLYELLKLRKELEALQKSVTDLTNNQSHLNRLRLLVTEVTNSALQSLVDSINNCVNAILEDLFESTISLELKLFKENKANSKVKPMVNFTIYYNGNTYENVNALSGGEKDRISLALTLALACVNPSPILFLDECMASLNGDLREACIEAIKKFVIASYRKTVINICHETVEGYYDEVLNV